MRTTLTLEVKIDTRLVDEPRREMFKQLVRDYGAQLYGQAAMLSEAPPTVTLTTIDRNGKTTVPLFTSEQEEAMDEAAE